MKSLHLAGRNLKSIARDPLSLALTIALPALMLLVLQSLEDVDDFFTATNLAPGILLFGFVMLMFSSAMILSRDRETALFSRLLTTPLTATAFLAAYSLPYVAIAALQTVVVFGIAAVLGLDLVGSALLVLVILLAMALLYIGLGMILGSVLNVGPLSGAYSAVLLITIFAGTWFDLSNIGGPIESVQRVLPFVHALDATREVMIKGAGFGDVATDLTWVLAYAVAVVFLAGFAFNRRMVEP
jgi:ABC-2 type transport system permease protein